MKRLSFAVCVGLSLGVAVTPEMFAQGPGLLPPQPIPRRVVAQNTSEHLSSLALDALVAGVALYPDPLVELILDAAQYPVELRQAARGPVPGKLGSNSARTPTPASIEALEQYPDVITSLVDNLPLTTRLGRAYQRQPADVWAAVERIRNQIDQQLQSQPANGTTGAVVGYGGSVAASRVIAARLYAPRIVNEIYSTTNGTTSAVIVHTNPETVDSSTRTVVGPENNSVTVTGGGATEVRTVGNTTVAGTAGAANIQTSNGTQIGITGGAKGSVTKTENGATFQTQAAGGVVTNTGIAAGGTRTSAGTVSQNEDGSTTVDKSSNTQIDGVSGSAEVERETTATKNEDGTRSRQTDTSINTTQGSADVSTTVGGGQASTTISSDKGDQTFTAGDGQVTNPPRSSEAQASKTSKNSNTSTRRSSNPKYQHINEQQIAAANEALSHNWNQLSQQSSRNSIQSQAPVSSRPPTRQTSSTRQPTPTRQPQVSAPPQNRSTGGAGRNGGGRSGGGRGGRR